MWDFYLPLPSPAVTAPPARWTDRVAIRAKQSQSEPIRANQSQSVVIGANQRHSEPIRANQSQSEQLRGTRSRFESHDSATRAHLLVGEGAHPGTNLSLYQPKHPQCSRLGVPVGKRDARRGEHLHAEASSVQPTRRTVRARRRTGGP